MEEIARDQQILVEDFNKLLSTIKKDPVDRRNKSNIQKRRAKLEELWTRFNSNDEEAKTLGISEHIYFSSNCFANGEQIYDSITALLNQYERQLEQQTAMAQQQLAQQQIILQQAAQQQKTPQQKTPQPMTPQQMAHQPINQQNGDQFKIIQIEKKITAILNDIQAPTFLDGNQTERELNWKLQTLTNRWEKLQELYESITLSNGELSMRQLSQRIVDAKKEVDIKTRRLFDSIEDVTVKKSVHLPEINIPKFSGIYEEWSTFHDLFVKVIHQRPHLSKVEKFQYLKSRLIGEPSKLIRNLTITEVNYDTAWDTLKSRYHNEKLLTFSLLDKIVNFPKIHGESATKLKELHDTIQDCTTAISNLGTDTSKWSVMLDYLIISKWDDKTSQMFEQISEPNKLPNHEEVMQFMIRRFQSLESCTKKDVDIQTNKFRSNCRNCRGNHVITQCDSFKSLGVEERWKVIKKLELCRRCLRHGSQSKCYEKNPCHKCKRDNHHTLLHQAPQSQKPSTPSNSTGSKQGVGATAAKQTTLDDREVLLSTAVVKVQAADGEWIELRVLLDPGSQMSFISENGAQLLGLPRQRTQVVVTGIGGAENSVPKSRIWAEIKPRFTSPFRLTAELMVLSKVTDNLPHAFTEDRCTEEWKNIVLADPTFNRPGPIDMLLGADVQFDIVLPGIKKYKDDRRNRTLAQNTQLGWVLSGFIKLQDQSISSVRSMIARKDEDVQLTKFWRMEEVPEEKPLSEEEKRCEEVYGKTTTRREDGRYVVRLPFKSDPDTLGQSRSRAVARFIQIEKRLEKDNERYEQYKKFMQEYEEMGHMEKAADLEAGKYYIPHQAVIKEDSNTTKLRVVFDASCKTSSGESLNDKLHNGPRLQEDIPCILLRWRSRAVIFKADIEKMYRQIMIHPDDQDYQRILWRASRNMPIQEYKLRTVTYGTTSAPYLAIKTLQRLATDEAEKYPVAASAMLDFYVDDVLSGADNIEEALVLQKQLNAMMESGGMTLRKWSSNCTEVIEKLPIHLQDNQEMELNKEETKKSLGVHWNPKTDVFLFRVKMNTIIPTKRNILSEIAKLYDPLGWLSPVTIVAKLMIQELWIKELEWDQQVPDELKNRWETFSSKIKNVEMIKIPRWMHWMKNQAVELHGFADASEKAYGGAVYSRIIQEDGSIKTCLLMSKSKVAPIKMKKTLPRLELCAAELLARLLTQVKQSLKIPDVTIYGWTDSMITLAWIKGDATRWKNFVANRVASINEHIPADCWNHVRTNDNPADLVSRGVLPEQLQDMRLWWNGPTWLTESKSSWTTDTQTQHTNEEAKRCSHTVLRYEKTDDVIDRFSSYTRMLRVMTWCWRFIQRCRKIKVQGDTISAVETNETLMRIIKYTQKNEMPEEVQSLESKKAVHPRSRISSLNPYMDQDGIIRVGGRIKHATIPARQRHPIILPKESTLTTLIIRFAHVVTLHGGNQLTSAYCRRLYWIIHGKQRIRRIINACPTCIRYKGETLNNIMGNLPEPRINPSPPFHHTGVDYAGPIQIRTSKGRGTKSYKGYIAIFVCFATKAVHIEVVSDMTSDAFLAAFRRFVSRRGQCAHVYSDNGTTFVGANKFMKDSIATQGIQWHFIPPASPHWGGLWERAVRSMKHHLKRIVGEATLTYEELSTLTQQIEACLNSRPLWPLTNDPEDIEALTPGHFLIGRPILAPAEITLDDEVINHSTRWTMIQKMKRQFWKVWSSEYLHSLQQRHKWKQSKPNIEAGELVLVKDDNLPPGKWPLARIAEIHPADDGTVRVVTVRQADKRPVKRPITKLVPLESAKVQPTTRCTGMRSRTSVSSTTALMTMCLLSALAIANANFTIKAVPPGIYVEHVGEARINRGTFRLEVDIPKAQIYYNARQVNKSIASVNELCQKATKFHTDIQCAPLLHHLKEQQKEFEWVMESINHTTTARRVKRGLLGKMLTAVFGVNEEVYQNIDNLDENQQKLIKKSTHQTKLLLSATSNIRRIEERLNNTLQRLTSKINRGIETINNITSWYHNTDQNHLTVVINIMEAFQLANSYIEDVNEVSSKLLDLVLGRGHIYQFISPAQVIESLHKMSFKLPNNVQIWPNPVVKTTYSQINESIVVMGYFVISETAEYTLMKLTPTPLHIRNNTYWTADVTNNFLAVEYDLQLYYEMTESEYANSLKVDNHIFITSPTIVKSIEHSPDCIIDYLYDRKDNFSCPIYKRPVNTIIWKQLYMPNAWMFITASETRIAVICSGNREDIRINQTGVISVTDDCSIQTGQSILNPVITANVPVLSSSMKAWSINLSQLEQAMSQPTMPIVSIATEPIIHLVNDHDTTSSDLEDVNDETWKHTHHRYDVTTGLLTTSVWFLLLCLLYTLSRCIWRKWCSDWGAPRLRAHSAPTDLEMKEIHQPMVPKCLSPPLSRRSWPPRQDVQNRTENYL